MRGIASVKDMPEGPAAFFGKQVVAKMLESNPKWIEQMPEDLQKFFQNPMGIAKITQNPSLLKAFGADEFLATLLKTLNEQTKSMALQPGYAEKFLVSIGAAPDFLAANGILKLGGTIADPQNLTPADRDAIKKGKELAASETSQLIQGLKKVEQGIMDIANGVLGMMLMTLGAILIGLKVLVDFFTNRTNLDNSQAAFQGAMEGIGKYASLVGSGAIKVGHGLGETLTTGPMGDLWTLGQLAMGMKPKPGTAEGYALEEIQRDAMLRVLPPGMDMNKYKKTLQEVLSRAAAGKSMDPNKADSAVDAAGAAYSLDDAGFQAFVKSIKGLPDAQRAAIEAYNKTHPGMQASYMQTGETLTIVVRQVPVAKQSTQQNASGSSASGGSNNKVPAQRKAPPPKTNKKQGKSHVDESPGESGADY
jgi:hypothetical protein